MSSKQIMLALVKKGYPVESVKYIRNAPTPSGYGKGYDVDFINVNDSFTEIEDSVFDFDPSLNVDAYMEFDDFQQAMDWVNSLPDINQLRKEQAHEKT